MLGKESSKLSLGAMEIGFWQVSASLEIAKHPFSETGLKISVFEDAMDSKYSLSLGSNGTPVETELPHSRSMAIDFNGRSPDNCRVATPPSGSR